MYSGWKQDLWFSVILVAVATLGYFGYTWVLIAYLSLQVLVAILTAIATWYTEYKFNYRMFLELSEWHKKNIFNLVNIRPFGTFGLQVAILTVVTIVFALPVWFFSTSMAMLFLFAVGTKLMKTKVEEIFKDYGII